MNRRRRSVALLVALLPLVGCGSSEGGSEAEEASTGDVTVVDHVFGETEIEGVPERVVTLDLQWTDTALALGVEPVGAAVDSLMPGGQVPWRDGASGEELDLTDGVPMEQISDLEPDLILGSFSITDEETYETLSKIAPTVATLGDGQVDLWQDMAEAGGQVLDREDEADALVEEVDAQVAEVAGALPGLDGKSFLLARFSPGQGFLAVGDPEDGSSLLFEDLGLELYGPVVEEAERTGDARVAISEELTDLLSSDLLALSVIGGTESDLDDVPGYSSLPGTTTLLYYATVVGLNTPTPLSVPYVLDALRPALDQVAATGP